MSETDKHFIMKINLEMSGCKVEQPSTITRQFHSFFSPEGGLYILKSH